MQASFYIKIHISKAYSPTNEPLTSESVKAVFSTSTNVADGKIACETCGKRIKLRGMNIQYISEISCMELQ